MRWFGPTWDSPVNHSCELAPAPIGKPCGGCDRPIVENDRGVILPHVDESQGETDLRALVMGTAMPGYVVERPWHLRCILAAFRGREP